MLLWSIREILRPCWVIFFLAALWPCPPSPRIKMMGRTWWFPWITARAVELLIARDWRQCLQPWCVGGTTVGPNRRGVISGTHLLQRRAYW